MNIIYVWPDGDWAFEEEMDYPNSFFELKSDDYSQVRIPEGPLEEDIDTFVQWFLNNNPTGDQCVQYWEDWFSN